VSTDRSSSRRSLVDDLPQFARDRTGDSTMPTVLRKDPEEAAGGAA
jgi:hypothetical protein